MQRRSITRNAGMAMGLLAVLGTSWACLGCTSGANRERTKYFFEPLSMASGFEHPWFHYTIARDPSAVPGDFFPGFRVENYLQEEDGTFRPRSADEYVQSFDIDVEDDEQVDIRGLRSVHDLRLIHRSTGALMWIASIPAAGNDAGLEPRFALTEYIDQLGGTLTHFTEYGTRSRTFVAQVESTGPAMVDGLVGAAATVNFRADHRVADDSDASAPVYTSRYVMIAAPFSFRFRAEARPSDAVERDPYQGAAHNRAARQRMVTLPARVVFGYTHHTSDFTTHLADFERFVQAFSHADARGETTGIMPPVSTPTPESVAVE